MPTRIEDLKNCFLVAFKASVHGGLSYKHSDQKVMPSGKREDSEWKTEKTLFDKEERNAGVALASRVKRAVDNMGRSNALGTIVPAEREDELDKVIEKCREDIREFNAKSTFTNLRFTALKFYISGENEVALDDMLQDLRGTLDELKQALKTADLKSIRSVVSKLKGFDAVLPDNAADYLQRAIADARAQAKEIRKSVEERGQELEEVQKEMDMNTVDYARFAVMEPGSDLDDVDSPLVSQLLQAEAESRGAGIYLGGDEDEDDGDNVVPFPGEQYVNQVMMP